MLAVATVGLPSCLGLVLALVGAGGPLAWLAAVAVGGFTAGVWFLLDRSAVPWLAAVITSLLPPLLVIAFATSALQLVSGAVPSLTLQQALISDATVLAIDGAVVKSALVGEDLETEHGAGLRRTYVAAPIVPPDWAPGEVVEAWLRCEGTPASCAEVLARPPVGVALRDAPDDAITDAVARHGLATPDRVLILRTSPGARLDAMVVLAGLGFGLVVASGAALAVTSLRRRAP